MCELCWETYVTSFRGLPHYQRGLIILLKHKSIMAVVNCDTLNATSNALQATNYILGCIVIYMLIYIRGMDPCWKKVKIGYSQFRNSGTLFSYKTLRHIPTTSGFYWKWNAASTISEFNCHLYTKACYFWRPYEQLRRLCKKTKADRLCGPSSAKRDTSFDVTAEQKDSWKHIAFL